MTVKRYGITEVKKLDMMTILIMSQNSIFMFENKIENDTMYLMIKTFPLCCVYQLLSSCLIKLVHPSCEGGQVISRTIFLLFYRYLLCFVFCYHHAEHNSTQPCSKGKTIFRKIYSNESWHQ